MQTVNNNNCSVNISINNFTPSKQCNKCFETKPLSDFHKNKNARDGCDVTCKRCKQKYYQENKKHILERSKEYYQNNHRKINERNSKRYHSDQQVKAYVDFKRRINNILSGRNKSQKTLELLGCSFEQLTKWMSYQFTPEMSWQNYGKYWVCDHFIPCSSFNVTNVEEQKKCYNYSNLQPLEKITNIQKSNKRDIEAEMSHILKFEKFKQLMENPLL